MGLRSSDAQQSAMIDHERSAGSQSRRPPDNAYGRPTRIDREVLQFIDVQPSHAFFKRDNRPENTIYMSNEDTLLNNGSLIGINLSRVFHIHDFAMVSAVMGAQWTATGVRTVLPLDNSRTEFVTHALITEVLPTGVRLFSRCLQKPIDAAVDALPAVAIDDAGSPAVRPHQTVVARVHKGATGEAYVAVAVELLPLHCGKGVIYLVREEFSVILYDEPPGNERLPFRYVLAPNDVIKAGSIPLKDWYGRRVEFAACVDQPDGSEEFLEGRRYKAVQATIVVNEPRTKHYRSRGVVYSRSSDRDDGRDDAAPSVLRSDHRGSTPSDVLSLEDKVLNEWRMVHKVADDEKGADDSFVQAGERASSMAGDASGGGPLQQQQQVARQLPINEVSAFTSSKIFTSLDPSNTSHSPVIPAPVSRTTESSSAPDRGDQQNLISGFMEWDEEAERCFAAQLRQAQEESLRANQRPVTETTGNAEDDQLQQAIAISMEEERLRLNRLREQEERDLEAALNASRIPSDEQLQEVLALSRREAVAFGIHSPNEDEDYNKMLSNGMKTKQEQFLADVHLSPPAVGADLHHETSIKEIIDSETADRIEITKATSKQPNTVTASDIEELLFADTTPAIATPSPPLSAKPVDVNAFFQRQLEEFLSSAPTSPPVAKTKIKESTIQSAAPVANVNLLCGMVSDPLRLSPLTLNPVPVTSSKSPTPIDWAFAPEEPKMTQMISKNDEKTAPNDVKNAVAETDHTLPVCEAYNESSTPLVDGEERSTVELIDEDEVGSGNAVDEPPTLIANETRKTTDDESDDDGSVTPTPDLELQLPEEVNEELKRVSQSQPVYDRMVAIATCLAAHNPKAGMLLEELKKLEKK